MTAARARRHSSFWSEYVARGAQFRVAGEGRQRSVPRHPVARAAPAAAPRRAGGRRPIDLPYSNFAYGQTGTPWPVNQAVYVDYMLYDLRGYHAFAAEELLAQYRNNQEANGHVNGFANWVVYTPGMLYAVAQDYLLSRRPARASTRLLPAALKALDWCLGRGPQAANCDGPSAGLVAGPLNDGTGEGSGPSTRPTCTPASTLSAACSRRSAIRAPRGTCVPPLDFAHGHRARLRRRQLRLPAGPTARPHLDALRALRGHTYGRLLDQWYPTDVDTGAVHLLRLKAVPAADGELADWLLNDHEDNLFFHGWGIANEPVYNQQATAYLLRDDPKAAIRTFYSYMASAFSHSVFEPVEHRWTHGQYFGPPSHRRRLVRALSATC